MNDERFKKAYSELSSARRLMLVCDGNDLEGQRRIMRHLREASLALNSNVLSLQGRNVSDVRKARQ